MITTLKTANVFLDTDVFRSRNFACHDAAMRKVIDLASNHSIHVYLTAVTVEQIKIQISRFVDAIPVVKHLEKEFGEFWDRAELATAFKQFSRGDVAAEILADFTTFCKEAQVEIIPGSLRSIDEFAFSSMVQYCAERKMGAYVISRDKRFAEACEGQDKVFHLETLEEFIDLVVRENALASPANEAFEAVRSQVAARIKENFKDTAFRLEDVSGEVSNVTVTDIKLSKQYLIDADEQRANFYLLAEIKFNADVTYEKPGTGIWDNELGGLISVEMMHETIESRFDEVEVSVTLALEKTDPNRSKIKEILLNRDEDFAINILSADSDLK